MLRVTPMNKHCCRSLPLLERYHSASTEIILSSRSVVHPTSTSIFWFRRVYRAKMWMERKYIACEVDRLLHTLLNVKRLIAFFSAMKAQDLLLYRLVFCFHPCQIPFRMPNRPVPPWDIGKTWGWFSLYETEKLTPRRDSWDIAVSSSSLSAAPSWMSGIHRHWGGGGGENCVCLNFKNRLLAGNEYPATVAQLCLSESKSNPRGC